MLNIADIPKIKKAWSSLKPDEVLGRLSYENNLLHATKGHKLLNGWYYYGWANYCMWSPIFLEDTSRDPMEFFKENPEITHCSHYQDIHSISHKPSEKKSKYATFLYTNSEENLSLNGKEYAKFRQALNYMKDNKITIEQYSENKPVDLAIVLEVKCLIDSWKTHKKENIKEKVNYEPFEVISNLYDYGTSLEYLTTIIRYDGVIIHYETSERIHPNYIIISDLKPNVSLPKEVATKFGYVNRLNHYTHLVHWHNKYIEQGYDKSFPIYYNIGDDDWVSYKSSLKPSHIVSTINKKVGKPPVKKSLSNQLF
jgi:hypothetical protein